MKTIKLYWLCKFVIYGYWNYVAQQQHLPQLEILAGKETSNLAMLFVNLIQRSLWSSRSSRAGGTERELSSSRCASYTSRASSLPRLTPPPGPRIPTATTATKVIVV